MNATTRTTALSAVLFVCVVARVAAADVFVSDVPELIGTFVHGQAPISASVDFGVVPGSLASLLVEFTATGAPGFSSDVGEVPAEIVVSVLGPNGVLIRPSVLGPFEATPTTLDVFNAWYQFDGDLAGSVSGGYMIEVLIETNDIYAGIVTHPVVDILNVDVTVVNEEPFCSPGDIGCDGFVGIAELNIVLGNWNQNVPPADPRADNSGDGFVGIADLNWVLSRWNSGTPPTANAVPEPATLALLGLGLLSMIRCGRGT